jgi:hypothetical protein
MALNQFMILVNVSLLSLCSHVHKDHRCKFDSHNQECIFLGHLDESKAYYFMQNFNKRIIVFRNVFEESSLRLHTKPLFNEFETNDDLI